jgi:lactoylglutathione lyase
MKFQFNHNNINVSDLERSVTFYKKALGLVETRRFEPPDKSFLLVFLGDEVTTHKLELTWLRDHPESVNGHLFHRRSGRILGGNHSGEEIVSNT